MKNLSLSAPGIVFFPYIPLHVTRIMPKSQNKLPRQRKTFARWIEGQAFSDLLDTGEKDIQTIIDLHARHGVEYAWLAFCALTFIEVNGLDNACLEALKLYIEVIQLNIHSPVNGMTADQENDMLAHLVHACQGLERYNIRNRGHSRYKLRTAWWPIKPKPFDDNDLLQLAHFLIIFTSDKIERHAHLEKGYGLITTRALKDIIRVYNEYIRPKVL